jgi:hypothetical protein
VEQVTTAKTAAAKAKAAAAAVCGEEGCRMAAIVIL